MSVAAEITVVIPSRRGPRLAFALEALAEQTVAPGSFEVVVVRDGESSGSIAAPDGLRVSFLEVGGATGPTAKRNAGWRSTETPWVAFTDDDCRPAPEWLDRLLAGLRAAGSHEVLVQGRTVPDPDEVHLLHGLARSQTVKSPSRWFQCCNLACSRALLEAVDGFDEDFYFGGEDTDFGARAVESGAVHEWVPEAEVRHAVIPRGLGGAIREAARWPSLPLILRRHPAYREEIHHRFFWKESHPLVLAALLGGAVATRRPLLGLALMAPYISFRTDRAALDARGLARQAAGLPARALVDLIEVGATVRAAARHRVGVV